LVHRTSERRPGRSLKLVYLCEECAEPVLSVLRSNLHQDVVDCGLEGVPVSVFHRDPESPPCELYGGVI
jgi:hypothetical protein